jgi:hypothetical protein
MQWKSTRNGELPVNGQQVIVAVDGVNYVAVYDGGKKIFRVDGEPIETFFRISDHEINWAEEEKYV